MTDATKWARIVEGKVFETIDVDPATLHFGPDMVWVPCPKNTNCHDAYDSATGTFTPYVPAESPAPADYVPPPPPTPPLQSLDPMTFYLAFTPAERIAIKTSADPIVKEFWDTYQLAADLKKNIDPNLNSVIEGLNYLATPTTASPPGAGILASPARVAQIQAGIPQ